jgi:hypothetical protein
MICDELVEHEQRSVRDGKDIPEAADRPRQSSEPKRDQGGVV